jgi:hypothetical protein
MTTPVVSLALEYESRMLRVSWFDSTAKRDCHANQAAFRLEGREGPCFVRALAASDCQLGAEGT